MKLELGMKMVAVSRRRRPSEGNSYYAEVEVTRIGRKYAYVFMGQVEYKFNINVLEKAGDNRNIGTHGSFELYQTIDQHTQIITKSRVVSTTIAKCGNYNDFKPTYQQCLEIAKIMNWSLE